MPVTGADVIKRNFRRIQRVSFDALERSLIESAEKILTEANNKAPQDTGDMIDTSLVTSDSNERKAEIEVAVAYTKRYAVLQHERVFNPGPITAGKIGDRPGAGRKWLQKVMDKRRTLIIADSGKAVARALRVILR